MSTPQMRARVPTRARLASEGSRVVDALREFAVTRKRWLLRGAGALAAALLLLTTRLYFYDTLPAGLSAPDSGAARAAQRKVDALRPRGVFILIDAAHNRLYLKKGDRVLHEATCSTGSGMLLRDPAGNRQWVFDTPRGIYHVRNKVEDPVWTKPDWAFVEEGKPIPQSFSERRDDATLGDYALYFGDGFMIHGTLYQRYLGRNITHGCVRLGDQDLERVFHAAPLGTPIYIY